MLIEHMRSLPRLQPGENAYEKKEYFHVNTILTRLFRAKYPEWTQTTKSGSWDVNTIPNGEAWLFSKLLRGCAGAPVPEEVEAEDENDD
jgi:hypothetical protein